MIKVDEARGRNLQTHATRGSYSIYSWEKRSQQKRNNFHGHKNCCSKRPTVKLLRVPGWRDFENIYFTQANAKIKNSRRAKS